MVSSNFLCIFSEFCSIIVVVDGFCRMVEKRLVIIFEIADMGFGVISDLSLFFLNCIFIISSWTLEKFKIMFAQCFFTFFLTHVFSVKSILRKFSWKWFCWFGVFNICILKRSSTILCTVLSKNTITTRQVWVQEKFFEFYV